MALLEVKDFSFKYNEEKVLKDINFKINEGEFVLLCGPSGSGKTTLLNNIKKELKPAGDTYGQIFFDDIVGRILVLKNLFQNLQNSLIFCA